MEVNNKNFISRPGVIDDLGDLLDLYNEYWHMMTGVEKFTLEEFKTIFSTPNIDLNSSLRVVTTKAGEITGSVLVIDLADPPIHPNVYGCVRKGYEGRGIGSFLLDWGETRARKAIDRCPEEARVSMYVQATPDHHPSVQLLEKSGFTPIRYSWFMMRDLEQEIPDPKWPETIKLKNFEEYSDLKTILTAVDDAFQDHWGHVDRSGDERRFERFKHSIESDVDFDPTIWYLAVDNGEIAGLALCSSKFGREKDTGLIDTLGVRRPWRRRGLGLALLHHAFIEFRKRGYKRVGLGVDTQNLSGATRLYKKAGMRVTQEIAVYEKELRSGIELSKQSA
jgi:GNAT superfamily N-acetyltransferase